MGSFALISSDDRLNAEVRRIQEGIADSFEVTVLRSKAAAIQFLNYELPEIHLINWSDPSGLGKAIVEEIKKDPWLHYGASLIVFDGEAEGDVARQVQGLNLVSLIEAGRLSHYLRRVLATLYSNRSLLTQWNFHQLVQTNLTGSFLLERDAFDFITHTNLLANYLFNSNLISRPDRENLSLGLMNALRQAVEKDRTTNHNFLLTYQITPRNSVIEVQVEGDTTMDWSQLLPARSSSASVVEVLEHDRVRFSVGHLRSAAGLVPGFFQDQQETVFAAQDVVFSQGEESNHLYYIVSGDYEVLANGRRVAILTPKDVFVGEMSFLLKNKRTATVRALGPGKLIKITKQEFVQSLKDKPHYGFFLSRMLAERLDRLHQGKT
ncbi:MAG: cyclic nucleotide-binding domain-containing protein [Spirochaetales bacterium]